jgi:hypothetical protein
MLYVHHALASYWDQANLRWRDLALDNLASSSESLWTHEFKRESGELYAVAMMHPDGIGPARLLLRAALERTFPAGYEIAAPEMSCAFVLGSNATGAERQKIQEAIAHCYTEGTRPLADGLFEPDDLTPEASGLTSA